jgi:hypothetical protein
MGAGVVVWHENDPAILSPAAARIFARIIVDAPDEAERD